MKMIGLPVLTGECFLTRPQIFSILWESQKTLLLMKENRGSEIFVLKCIRKARKSLRKAEKSLKEAVL